MEYLIKTLELSVKLNGPTQVVTIGHLLNIVKYSEKLKRKYLEKRLEQEWFTYMNAELKKRGK